MSDLKTKTVDGMAFAVGFDDKEPRVRDVALAAWLGFASIKELRQLIERHLDEIEAYGVLLQFEEKSQKQGRPASYFYLNEPQALLVGILSRTAKAAEVRRALIVAFGKVKNDVKRYEYLEARILAFDERRNWERLWGPTVVAEICRLHRWPTVGSTGCMYAPLRGVFDRLYRIVLGDEVVDEIKKRNPDPRHGQNHHQLLQEKARDMVGNDIQLIEIFARQSATTDEWTSKLRAHFQREPYQLTLSAAASSGKR